MTAAIEIDDVSLSLAGSPILKSVNLRVQTGEFIGLVGPNGGGKSTLLKLMLGLLQPDQGRIHILGMTADKGRLQTGYVPQYAAFERDFPITVQETVLLGRLGHTPRRWGFNRADKLAASRVLREMEIDHLKNRPLAGLSGGQMQRVLIARAMVTEPVILLLDEPTANIDLRVEENVFDLLKSLNQKATIVVVSHDIGFISGYVGRVACLNQTLVCHDTASVDGRVIEDLYGSSVHMIDHHH